MTSSSFDTWVVIPKPVARPRVRLFCLPYAGGNASIFRPWADLFPPDVQVCAVQLPGRQRRAREAPYTRMPPLVDALAEVLAPHADRPFALFGNCTGSLIAFEVARRLRDRGRSPAHLFVSCCRAPQLPDTDAPIHGLPDDAIRAELDRLGGTPPEVAAHPELLQMILPTLRSDFELAESYVYEDAPALDCPITAFAGAQDRIVSAEQIAGWAAQTRGAFSQQRLEGDHYLLDTARAPLVSTISGALQATPGEAAGPRASSAAAPAQATAAQGLAGAGAASATSGREGHVEVPGGRIWYRVVGAGAGTPVITLHGGPGSPHEYLGPLGALGDDRPVVFYDQLGCGRSDRPTDASLWQLPRFVEELRALRRALGFERFFLLGHSWGTMVATEEALSRPEGLAGLILMSPCLSMSRVIADMDRLRRGLPAVVQQMLSRHEATGNFDSGEYRTATMVFYQRHLCRLPRWPEVLQRSYNGWAHDVYREMWGPAEFHVTGNLASYERADRLPEIAVPTLFACGRRDEITPEATAWYASLVPGAELSIFEQSAHLPHLEEPAQCLAILRDFLRRADVAPRA